MSGRLGVDSLMTTSRSGAGIRDRPKEHCVNDAEDRRVGADPEREREDGGCGEPFVPAQLTQGVSHVLRERIDERPAALIAIGFLDLLDSAELAASRGAGVVDRHPSS